MNLLFHGFDFSLDLDHKKGSVSEVRKSDSPVVEVTEKFVICHHLLFHGDESILVSADNIE